MALDTDTATQHHHESLEAVLERLERVYGEELSSRDHVRLSSSSKSTGRSLNGDHSHAEHDSSNSVTASNQDAITSNGASSSTTPPRPPRIPTPDSDGKLYDYDDPDTSMLPVLVAICLIQHNDPSDFARLFHYFANSEKHSSTILLSKFVLRLRTALFKAVPLVGVPRVINALASLNEAVLSHEKAEQIMDELPSKSSKPTKTTEEDSIAGWAFFKAIYAQHAEKIIDNIGKTSPDLAEMIVDELYGANLSRKEVLSWKETVLIEFVGCASLACPAQAKGHFFGCKNLKVSKKSMEQAIEVLREIGNWIGQPLQEDKMPFIHNLDRFS